MTGLPTIQPLTVDEVLVIHGHLLSLDGGLPGVKNLGALESALAQPGLEVFGEQRYVTVLEQAGAYLFYLSKAHAFNDGNKRTAVACMLTWLELHGEVVQSGEDRLEELVLKVAAGEPGYETPDAPIAFLLEWCVQD